jgi:hypothetical protein
MGIPKNRRPRGWLREKRHCEVGAGFEAVERRSSLLALAAPVSVLSLAVVEVEDHWHEQGGGLELF